MEENLTNVSLEQQLQESWLRKEVVAPQLLRSLLIGRSLKVLMALTVPFLRSAAVRAAVLLVLAETRAASRRSTVPGSKMITKTAMMRMNAISWTRRKTVTSVPKHPSDTSRSPYI
jgi:hypothetical protein